MFVFSGRSVDGRLQRVMSSISAQVRLGLGLVRYRFG